MPLAASLGLARGTGQDHMIGIYGLIAVILIALVLG
jgi:hypothetical protein